MSTIRDVAERAGVSVATVSHVINDTHYVSPELQARVFQAIKELNYRPNRLARALSRKAIPLLALIVPDISNPYWSGFARAVQDVTDEHGYSVIVCSTDGQLQREMRFLQSLSGWISGLIFHPYHVTQESLELHISDDVAVVILGEPLAFEREQARFDHVRGNNEKGALTAVEHLIRLGHERIGFVQGPPGTPTGARRLAGYQQALYEAGLPSDESLVVAGGYTRDAGRIGIAQLLDRPQPPTAVFCANDLVALGAIETAQQRGYRIPQDVSIVGFDDIDEAARASPPLTTIKQPPRRLGTVAAETLLERLGGRRESADIVLDYSLVVRGSTAAPNAADTRSELLLLASADGAIEEARL
jgi:DNA-binding LacI/PurR family transcriptional regulator